MATTPMTTHATGLSVYQVVPYTYNRYQQVWQSLYGNKPTAAINVFHDGEPKTILLKKMIDDEFQDTTNQLRKVTRRIKQIALFNRFNSQTGESFSSDDVSSLESEQQLLLIALLIS